MLGHLQAIVIYHHSHVSRKKSSVTESFGIFLVQSGLWKHFMSLYYNICVKTFEYRCVTVYSYRNWIQKWLAWMFSYGLWSWREMVCLLIFFANRLHQSIHHVSSSVHFHLLSFSSPPPLSSESQEQNSLKHLWQVHVNVQAWLKRKRRRRTF